MRTRTTTIMFTTGICLIAVMMFAAIAVRSHAETSVAGCSITKNTGLSIPNLISDYFRPDEPDPCTTSGSWKVPSQIHPGTYYVVPTGKFNAGSWTLCGTSTCRLGTPEMIDHTFITEPSVLTIPQSVKYIRTNDVRLEPVN